MSQLAKAVQYVDTGERVIINKGFSPLFTSIAEVKSHSSQDFVVGYKYRIGVKLEATATIPEIDLINGKTVVAVQRVKRQIVEAVFGEFRQDIEMIHLALNDYDVETARIRLIELQEKMYNAE